MSAPDQRLRAWWQQLNARQRRWIALAAAAILLALLWSIALAPALGTLRQAGLQRAALQAQAEQMRQFQRQAQTLKSLPRISQAEALRALQAAVKQRLGDSARLTVAAERATVTLKDAPAAGLANWLADARVNARATPIEARLTRSGDNAAAASWNGTLTLSLPSP